MLKRYVAYCYSDEKGLGEEKIFDTATEAVNYGRRDWNHLTKEEQKKNYINDSCGEFRVFEIAIPEEDLRTYADGELDATLQDYETEEIWNALESDKGISFANHESLDMGFSVDRNALHETIDMLFSRNSVSEHDDKETWNEQNAAKEELHSLIDAQAKAELIVKKVCCFLELIEKHNDRDFEGIDGDEECMFRDLAAGLDFVRPEITELED